jgi:DNA polymerase I-like protein with 3'-5' exonuclease and polymerase domains
MELAKAANYMPSDATKESHPQARAAYKECCLAVQYGLGAKGFARKIGTSPIQAQALLQDHKRTFRRFWAWSDDTVRYAILHRRLWSVFGWVRHYPKVREKSARNFVIQAAGAEILRLAIILGQQAGVKILAPLHDAVLIEFPLDQQVEAVVAMQNAMQRASELVLDGFALRSEAKLILHPDRYMEPRGRDMWDLVWEIVEKLERGDF